MIKNKPLRIMATIILCFAIAIVVPAAIIIVGNHFLILIRSKAWANSIESYTGRMISVVELKEEGGMIRTELILLAENQFAINLKIKQFQG